MKKVDLKEELRIGTSAAIRERIAFGTVMEVYDAWEDRGLDDALWEVLLDMNEDMGPILHAWVTNVHKEKGLFIDLISDSQNVPLQIRLVLGMGAELLWVLSLIIDDIQDDDAVRGGLDTAWRKYGRDATLVSAYECLESLLRYTALRVGSEVVVNNIIAYIQLGLNSMLEHEEMSLDSGIGQLVRNYERRCDFHATCQLLEVGRIVGRPDVFQRAAVGLRHINQAGQLFNDLRDFVEGDVYNRGFSDISRGVVSVPMVMMYQGLTHTDKRKFRAIFGSTPNLEDKHHLSCFVSSSNIVSRVERRALENYERGLSILKDVVAPEHYIWFEKWVNYKLESLWKVLD